MRQNPPARSFQSLMTLLILLAGSALVLLILFNPAGWLRQMRLSLPAGIHSPLYADYSADLRGMLVAPAEMRLLQEALQAQQAEENTILTNLLTPVPTVTPPAGNVQPTLPVVIVTPPEGGPTATLAAGITPTDAWTPTPQFTWTPTLTRPPSATVPGVITRTPGPTATLPPWTPTASLTPTRAASSTATFMPTPTRTASPTSMPTLPPTYTPTTTPTNGGYPPPATPPGYP